MQDEKRVQSLKLRVQELTVLFFIIFSSALFAETNWSLLPSRIDDNPGFTYHPSPEDWRNNTIYQIITDRFYDGDPSNNTANPDGTYNPLSLDGIHGGDFAGITKKLDYIQYLGFNTIWISPVFENHRGVYHGYHIINFNKIDPHWGTLDDLREMIDQAHARGMYVIIDVVFNHMARMTVSDDPGFPNFSDKPYKKRWAYKNKTFPPPFDDLSLFHAHGSITDWEDDTQNVIGELRGLADLKTENPTVRNYLLESHLALIAATDCDGFRVDTAHHVELDFWQEILPKLKEGAATLGKTNFLLFAEALRHRDDDVSYLTREGEFPSALYYPYYFTLKGIWALREPTSHITGRWKHRHEYGEIPGEQLITFGDNHDRDRLMSKNYLNGDEKRLRALLKHLYASPGIPCVYYGTEQGFNGTIGHGAREPMFDPLFEGHPDRMNPASSHAQLLKQLNQLRRDYPALQSGRTKILHDENAPGLFAFTRGTQSETILVVLNNSDKTRAIDPAWLESLAPDGEYVIELTSGNPFRVDLPHQIPADTTYMWTTETNYKKHVYIRHMEPPHGSHGITTNVTFKIVFNRSVSKTPAPDIHVMGKDINPETVVWTNGGSTATFQPTNGLPDNAWITWSFLHPGATERAKTTFHTGRPETESRNPSLVFKADGQLDESAIPVTNIKSDNLHVALNDETRMFYVATQPAAAHEDRFIMVAFSNHAHNVPAPWGKQGEVPGYDILISDEGESDYTSVRGTKNANWATSDKAGVFEAAIQLTEEHIRLTPYIFIRTATYKTEDGGAHIPKGDIPGDESRARILLEALLQY